MRILRQLIKYSKKYDAVHAWPMFFYMIAYLLWFSLIEILPRKYYLQVILVADRYIPFIEQFVIPYYSWFFYVAFGCVLIYLSDRNEYDRLCTMLIMGMTLFLIVSTILPTRQPLRLTALPRHNIFTRMIGKLWMTDTPTNVWPSIHVYNTTVIEIAFFKAKSRRTQNRTFRIVTLIWAVLIILSTMFCKQHSLFDVLSALSFAAIGYGIVYISGHVIHFRKWEAWVDRMEKKMDSGDAA